MIAVLLALLAGVVSFLAFPPIGPGWLIVIGIAIFLVALRRVERPRVGLLAGSVYGLTFFGGLMWWLSLLDPLALVLIPVQAAFFAVYGWWMARQSGSPPTRWALLATGAWALMEVIRYRFPVGGQEWGAAGYALSDNLYLRFPAAGVGTTGLTVIIVHVAATITIAVLREWDRRFAWGLTVPVVAVALAFPSVMSTVDLGPVSVAIVQGSTPCPFEHCPPDERRRTYEQHLALTATIEPGSVDLVVWPESSFGSTNADPLVNDDVREAMSAQATRIGSAMLVGGDHLVGEGRFINANVFFDREGTIVGEYRKQHPVPFGEYIPWRPLFGWIPALERVPRDMIPGDGPVVFDLNGAQLGSVISWEGGFSRYALEHRRLGADVLVVATNKSSYGPDAPTSEQFIGMTRMRAVELGAPVVHAAVTGKSTIIDHRGETGQLTETGESVILYGTLAETSSTIYTIIGDALLYLAVLAGAVGVVAGSSAGRFGGSTDRRGVAR